MSRDETEFPPESPARYRFRDHYAASQFRAETWNDLRNKTARLTQLDDAGRPCDRQRNEVRATLEQLQGIEHYWAFPGKRICRDLLQQLDNGWYRLLARRAAAVVRLLVSDAYRSRDVAQLFETEHGEEAERAEEALLDSAKRDDRPYFEVLVVDEVSPSEERELRRRLLDERTVADEFLYDIVVVPSFEDAVIAALFNHNLQTCVLRYRFPIETRIQIPELEHYIAMAPERCREAAVDDPCTALAEVLTRLRPELDLFKVTDEMFGSVAASDTRYFRRVFYRQEDYLELHLSILKGIRERYEAPFFDALREYSHKPTGVFHALPISRGKSITKSHWIGDMGRFYGRNIFLAETSSTAGGLDSLLQPTGPLKRAQEKVARAFGSRHSFFVTNGTSTANKIVM